MTDRLQRALMLALVFTCSVAFAESLVVDGRLAGRLDNSLVPGTTYVSLSDAQNALGLTHLQQGATLRLVRGADTTDLPVIEIEDPNGSDEEPTIVIESTSAVRTDGRTFVPIRAVLNTFNVAHDNLEGRLVAVTPRPSLISVEGAGTVVTVTLNGPATWRLSSNPLTGRHALYVPRADGSVTPTDDARIVTDLRVRKNTSGIQVDITATDRRAVATAVRDGRLTRIHVVLERHAVVEAPPTVQKDDVYQLALDLDTRGLSDAQARRWQTVMTTLARRLDAEGIRTNVSIGAQAVANNDARRGALVSSDAHIWFAPSLDTPGEVRVWRLPDEWDDAALPTVVRRADPDARIVRQVEPATRSVVERLQGAQGTDSRLSEELTSTLFERAGLLVGDVQQAVLPVLTEAAGRAVLIETDPNAARQIGFVDALEAAITSLAEGGL